MITYYTMDGSHTAVYLGGKRIGTIVKVPPWIDQNAYQYLPLGQKSDGERYTTLEECKKHLEGGKE